MRTAIFRRGLLLAALLATFPTEASAGRGWMGYGRYCGSSNNGGRPVDYLDAICRAHDRCLLNVGLPASPLSLLKKSKDAAKRSCVCDRAFSEAIADYPGGDGAYAAAASWVISAYAYRREALSCGSTL
jgi:hypothetical protein